MRPARPGEACNRHDSEDKEPVAGHDCSEPAGGRDARDDTGASYRYDHDEEAPPERGDAKAEGREPWQERPVSICLDCAAATGLLNGKEGSFRALGPMHSQFTQRLAPPF